MDCNSRKPRDKLASEAWRGLHYSLTPSTPPSRFLGLLLLRKAPTHTACQWFLVFSSRSHTSICLRGSTGSKAVLPGSCSLCICLPIWTNEGEQIITWTKESQWSLSCSCILKTDLLGC